MSPSPVERNVIANFAGRAWTGILSLAFIPLYVRLMGIETYGLVGVYVSLVSLISVLDLGLSSTLSRELARLSAARGLDASIEARDLVRTLEVVFWSAGALIGLTLAALAPWVARHWINSTALPEGTVSHAIAVMGLVIAVQWPTAIYEGGLTGLQRQVSLNAVRGAAALVQHGGAVLVLWLVSPTVLAYFTWQIVVSVGQTLALRHALRRALPAATRSGIFRGELIPKHGWFAAGMSGISILTIILTQTDKVVLSKLLPLETFGYYVLATNVASILVQIVTPFFAALFPRFTQVFAGLAEGVEAPTLYHASCQSVAAIVLPAAAVLILFPRELLELWLHEPAIARSVAPLARLLVIGQAMNALMVVPALVQMAFGWTRLILAANTLAVVILVPLMTGAVLVYGVIGGPVAWIILNAGYVLVMIPLMHRRLLAGEMWRWYGQDVALPAVAALVIAVTSRLAMPATLSATGSLLWIAATGAVAVAASAFVMPFTRDWIGRRAAGVF
jgi:O-antigen/teichoic acid export membrane protein